MSGRKYVPSFLRNQSETPNGGAGSNVNRFAAFDDDFDASKTVKSKSVTPTYVPSTLASLTTSKTRGETYASRFSVEQSRRSLSSPSTLSSTVKKLDATSDEQFPTLGSASKKQSGAWGNHISDDPSKAKFASLAKGWAKQTEDEEVATELKRKEEEKKRQEEEMIATILKYSSKMIKTDGFKNPDNLEDDYFYNPYASHDQFEDEDSVELPSEEEPTDEDDDEYIDENGEYNTNIVYDGRRKDDLY